MTLHYSSCFTCILVQGPHEYIWDDQYYGLILISLLVLLELFPN